MPALGTASRPPLLLRQALIALVACAAILVVAPGAQAAAPRPLGLPSGESLLFAMHAESGSLVRRSGNRYTLTLRRSARQTTWFADRPDRDAGRVLTRSLVRSWSRLGFSAVPPNAVLSTSRADDVVLELGRPRMHRPGLTLTIPVRTLGRRLPARRTRFGSASLFIDSASVGDGCGYTGQVRFFPERIADRMTAGFVPADGRSVSIAAYDDLARVLGSRFGGDSTSFTLPDVEAPAKLEALICATAGRQPRSAMPASLPAVEGDKVRLLVDVPEFGLRAGAYGVVDEADAGAATYAVRFLQDDVWINNGVPVRIEPSRIAITSDGTARAATCEPGHIDLFAQAATVWGYLPADGRVVGIGQHPQLFALLGNRFGGDGIATFGVPDVPAPAGMGWQICSFTDWRDGARRISAPTPDCVVSEIGYRAMDFTAEVGSRWVPATGRLYPQSQNLALFSLIFYEFGGSERLSAFGIPDVPEPVPGVRGNLCYAGTFPELDR